MISEQTIKEGKTLAVIGYLTIIGSVIAVFMNKESKNEFAAFHIRQGFGLCISYMIVGYLVSQFDNRLASLGFWVFFGILFFYGLLGAFTGKMYLIPFLGSKFQQWFKNL
ncbi:hypothetical protein [Mangrovimonas futianensis]|uniref:hypothetical protein n=1 Tax=Mangrovimonas futianensis TaxID=2895523 RepID=UPI001E50E715|nr:hypothetical protein [Mangrovimonas futianensis]MCF1421933.1 hypothetical protein [Mangrovimonas futianensis]